MTLLRVGTATTSCMAAVGQFRINSGDDTLMAFDLSQDVIRIIVDDFGFDDLVFTEVEGSPVIDFGRGSITLGGITQTLAETALFEFG